LKNSGKPLNKDRLQELALRYVSRYATTRYKLRRYLQRKLNERGWDDERPAETHDLIERFVEHGYIDDALYAKNKAAALGRRGYGQKRIEQAMYQSGIGDEDSREALDLGEQQKWQSAERFARKKSIGPFADEQADNDKSQKQLAAFMRAGHSFELASKFVFARPGETIEKQ